MLRVLRRASALLLTIGLVLGTGGPTAAQTADTGAHSQAWILVDADSGAVLAAQNASEPRFVASLVKVMTAFVVLEHVLPDAEIPVSDVAAAQPAMRIGMETGQVWTRDDALHALLMVSANDAAYALAEAGGGDLEGFARLMQETGERLGTRHSTFLDPAGLNGAEGFGGGSKVSAYDVAIVARNALEVPELMHMAGLPTFEFDGGDGKHHQLSNHNKLLQRYEGATGLKTGYTRAAGSSLVATAQRNGRRMIAVVLASTDIYGSAAALLDQGFATPPSSRGTGVTLPATSFHRAEAAAAAEKIVEPPAGSGGGGNLLAGFVSSLLGFAWALLRRALMVGFALLVIGVVLRRRAVIRQRRRRLARRRAYLDAKRRGMIEVVAPERIATHSGHVTLVDPDEGEVQVIAPRGRPVDHAGTDGDDDPWLPEYLREPSGRDAPTRRVERTRPGARGRRPRPIHPDDDLWPPEEARSEYDHR
jgi:D-alanyl-D-alanine carboxypeptidase (penicillin-binding protein 5/6)